ncbi:hypothetical protein [Aeromicrobium panaciterrae]|uniref:hypothetical protein n=1 Tax=Aeromicrobium panaciterrae TaxID=363861 RepID=UPI0031D92988
MALGVVPVVLVRGAENAVTLNFGVLVRADSKDAVPLDVVVAGLLVRAGAQYAVPLDVSLLAELLISAVTQYAVALDV